MFLNYFALLLILLMVVIIFYVFIYIHELPYEAAKHRNHPQQDAIYVACWLSLFTLHAIWPIVYIWAIAKQGPADANAEGNKPAGGKLEDNHTLTRLTQLENRLRQLEAAPSSKLEAPSSKSKKGSGRS